MRVEEVDALCQKMAELEDKMIPLTEELKELEAKYKEAEKQLADALVEVGKDNWVIPGRKPFRISVSTYWNITDIDKFFNKVKPDMLSVGYLGQAIRSYANAEVKDGRSVEDLGIKSYDKIKINGGQKQ